MLPLQPRARYGKCSRHQLPCVATAEPLRALAGWPKYAAGALATATDGSVLVIHYYALRVQHLQLELATWPTRFEAAETKMEALQARYEETLAAKAGDGPPARRA